MKIGHVTYSYKPIIGGQEAYIADLVDLFAKAGFDQHIYQPKTDVDDDKIVPLTRLFDFLPSMLAFDISLMPKRRQLRAEDVLLVNYPEVFPALAWHKKAVVISHGSTWTREGARSNDMRKRMAKQAWDTAPVFVANDTFVIREMGLDIEPRSHMFTEVAPRRWFLPNCVDSEKLTRFDRPSPFNHDKPVILVPRNLTRSRGADLALAAFEMIKEEHPDLKLVIVGDSIEGVDESAQFKKNLVASIDASTYRDDIELIGRVARYDMPAYYKAATVTLIPTRCSEGTSLAALESMACKTPVVATGVEGLLDLPVKHAQAEPVAIAKALLTVLASRASFAQNQQAAVSVVYDISNWKKCWLKIIDDISGRR